MFHVCVMVHGSKLAVIVVAVVFEEAQCHSVEGTKQVEQPDSMKMFVY